MLHLLLTILIFLLIITLIVGVHEWGHFFVARLFHVKILRFSIGFGKPLLRYTDKKGTEFVLSILPLGGYVKMLDEREDKVPKKDLPYAFNRKHWLQKICILVSGAMMNIVLAVLVYWIMFMIGVTYINPIIGQVIPGSIAANAGLKPQHKIIAVDNRKTPDWGLTRLAIFLRIGDKGTMNIAISPLRKKKITTHIVKLQSWKIDPLEPRPLLSLGIEPYALPISTIIDTVAKNSAADKSGLKVGDKILAVNQHKITHWISLITLIIKNPDETMLFTVNRHNKILKIPVTIGYKWTWSLKKRGFLGIAPKIKIPPYLSKTVNYPPIQALQHALYEMTNYMYLNIVILGKLLIGKISIRSLVGPITLFTITSTAIQIGLSPLLSFIAFFSLAVGIMNLLPIPGLDGGHICYTIIERIIQKPISLRAQALAYRIGMIIILLIIFQAVVNDVIRLLR